MPLWPFAVALAALAAVLAVRFAAAAAGPPGAPRVFPLDDPYIYFVYAHNTALGHFLAYNPGDGPSSGATSTLWTLLLAAVFRLGVHGQGIVPATFVLAAACLAAFAWTALAFCRRASAGPAGAGLCLAALFLYSRFAWGAFSGLEIPLSALGVAGLALALVSDSPVWAPLAGAAMTFVRPDLGLAAIPAVLLWAAERRRSRTPLALLPVAVAGAFELAWRLTGQPATNGTMVKTQIFAPGAHLMRLLRFVPHQARLAMGQLLTVHGHAGPFGFILAGLALTALVTRAGRALALFCLCDLVIEILAFGQGVVWTQFGRYDLPFLVGLALLACAGVGALLARVRWPLWPLGLAVAVIAATTLATGTSDYGSDSGQIRGQQIAASTYIATTLPKNAVIMLNDAGAMNYFGGHYTLDIEGLGSNGFALPMRAGTGAVYEHLLDVLLARPDLAHRPLYFVVYRDWFPGLDAAFGDCPAAFTVPGETILGGPTASLCAAALPTLPLPGLRTADLAQDHQFAYQAEPPGGTWLLNLPGPSSQMVLGAGRTVSGPESFVLPAVPGRAIALQAFTTETSAVTLSVHAGPEPLGSWTWPACAGCWELQDFTIPASAITGPSVRITLDGPRRLVSSYRFSPA